MCTHNLWYICGVLKTNDMKKFNEIPKQLEVLGLELQMKDERIASLEHTLEQLKSQLSNTHSEDSILITIINEGLKK